MVTVMFQLSGLTTPLLVIGLTNNASRRSVGSYIRAEKKC